MRKNFINGEFKNFVVVVVVVDDVVVDDAVVVVVVEAVTGVNALVTVIWFGGR